MSGRARDGAARDYDALLVVSFGGPEGPDDVSPFLDKVFRGLSVSFETKTRVAKRYDTFGGVSPINAQTRAFIKALQHELDAHGPALPIYWGNRNWHPLLTDTLAQMAHAGVRRALAYVTSTFSSYSGCRKYREDLYEAAVRRPGAPRIDKLRVAYNHPGFIEAMADRVAAAFDALPENERAARRCCSPRTACRNRWRAIAATKRSSMRAAASSATRSSASAGGSSIRATTRRTAASRGSVRTSVTALRDAKAEGATSVVIAPIGFVCDHMEVVLDLDVEAAAIARELGLKMARAATVGTHPAYVAMVRELIVERLTPGAPRRALGSLGPSHDRCAATAVSGRPGPRETRPRRRRRSVSASA